MYFIKEDSKFVIYCFKLYILYNIFYHYINKFIWTNCKEYSAEPRRVRKCHSVEPSTKSLVLVDTGRDTMESWSPTPACTSINSISHHQWYGNIHLHNLFISPDSLILSTPHSPLYRFCALHFRLSIRREMKTEAGCVCGKHGRGNITWAGMAVLRLEVHCP